MIGSCLAATNVLTNPYRRREMIEDYQKTNREKKMSPKRGKYWCNVCDREMVAIHEKCESCGNRINSRRIKKDI